MQQAIHKSFWAALLLTAHARYAEEVTTASIRSFQPEELPTNDFYLGVLTLAVRRSRGVVREQDLIHEPALSILPAELQAVLKLPLEERHQFVLRVLLRLPEQACASMLRTERYSSTDSTRDAIEDLAMLSAGDGWRPAQQRLVSVA